MTHEPRTKWGRAALTCEERIAELEERLKIAKAAWEDVVRSRCPKTDSGGARCTNDRDHEEKCRYDLHHDTPEAVPVYDVTRRSWGYGHWYRDHDVWDVR